MASIDNGIETIIKLPKSSFTAFRLTYFAADLLSDLSKCILLGRIPEVCKNHTGPGVFALTTRHARALVKRNFKSAAATIHSSIRGQGLAMEGSKEVEEGAFNMFLSKGSQTAKTFLQAIDDLEIEDSDLESVDNAVDLANDLAHTSLQPLEPRHVSEESSTLSGFDVSASKIPPLIRLNPTQSNTSTPQTVSNTQNDKRERNIFDEFLRTDNFNLDSHSFLGKCAPNSRSTSPEATLMISEHLIVPKPSVRFAEPKRKSRISLALPQPADEADPVVAEQRRKRLRFAKRINHIAAKSKREARKQKSALRNRVYLAILKNYAPGEVLRADKILLLTKIVSSAKNVRSFTENEPVDSRIYERWKQYYVVLRKTDDPSEPLTLQFYELMRMSNNTKRTPTISFTLSKDVNAELYSQNDKSISLIVPKKSGVLVYIFKCQSQITAYRWLFFIKQALGHVLDDTFHIDIPDLSTTIRLKLPNQVLKDSLMKNPIMLTTEKKQGYQVRHSTILEYLKQKIIEHLEASQVPGFHQWVQNTTRPWFCFRFYDRIEWVVNSSEVFYIQNQLLKESFKLEFRDMCFLSHKTQINDKLVKEPTPIEGFLSRLSSTNGHEHSLWRTFHKVLYFYTCKNLLFFTKFYRAEPPISEDEHKISPNGIYEHSPYPLDENGHITWLKDKDFETRDLAALAELERRSRQVIKAQALIDMTLIKDIRPVPFKKVNKMQRLLLCMLWYSDAELVEDETIVDSAFEMELINGAVLKLQAPNRILRDEWICKLTELKDYWLTRKRDEVRLQLQMRQQNMTNLKINEYIDSNIVQEAQVLEMKRSNADPKLHNIDTIAMSECVLMSGFLFQKSKKHSNFNKYYVVLCPGYVVLFTIFKRSLSKGTWKKTATFEHYLTIPIADCYIYAGNATSLDLLEQPSDADPRYPTRHSLPRLYTDGWRSSEDELQCCFTLWIGKKRSIQGNERASSKYFADNKTDRSEKGSIQKNPGLAKMIQKLGITGKSIVFKARSRQEREIWTHKLLAEVDRFSTS